MNLLCTAPIAGIPSTKGLVSLKASRACRPVPSFLVATRPRVAKPYRNRNRTSRTMSTSASDDKFTMADQVARYAKAKKDGNPRVLDIDSVYDGTFLKGCKVLVAGGNRGLGLAIVQECASKGASVIATCRKSSPELDAIPGVQIVKGIDVQDAASCAKLATEVKEKVDILIANAGYFYEPVEKICDGSLNFEEEMKMIDICAVGPLRVTSALYTAGLIKGDGGKVAFITSQGGSISWRTVQNPEGGDYGHHMSKAAANMAGALLAQELKHKGIMVTNLHPGFNKTSMTAKYAEIWQKEGAVDPSIGAKRVMHEIGLMSMDNIGQLINCEDGLQIPW